MSSNLVVTCWHKLSPRLQFISIKPDIQYIRAHFDFRWVGSLDIRQWTRVEFLLQSLREQDGQFGVVDELVMGVNTAPDVVLFDSLECQSLQLHDERHNRDH